MPSKILLFLIKPVGCYWHQGVFLHIETRSGHLICTATRRQRQQQGECGLQVLKYDESTPPFNQVCSMRVGCCRSAVTGIVCTRGARKRGWCTHERSGKT